MKRQSLYKSEAQNIDNNGLNNCEGGVVVLKRGGSGDISLLFRHVRVDG